MAPWDPFRKLVMSGPYRYVRNLMLAGVNLILVAEGILLRSPYRYVRNLMLAGVNLIFAEGMLLGMVALLGLSVAFVVVKTAYFVKMKEPGLRVRFGTDYDAYPRSVPRWIPRLILYRP